MRHAGAPASFGGGDEVGRFQRQDLRMHDARDLHPAGQPDHQRHAAQARASRRRPRTAAGTRSGNTASRRSGASAPCRSSRRDRRRRRRRRSRRRASPASPRCRPRARCARHTSAGSARRGRGRRRRARARRSAAGRSGPVIAISSGSCGASHGAPAAPMPSSAISTTPSTASRCRRNRRSTWPRARTADGSRPLPAGCQTCASLMRGSISATTMSASRLPSTTTSAPTIRIAISTG